MFTWVKRNWRTIRTIAAEWLLMTAIRVMPTGELKLQLAYIFKLYLDQCLKDAAVTKGVIQRVKERRRPGQEARPR